MGITEDIALLEQTLNELVIKYEQYFLGVEKREPLRQLQNLERLARRYTPTQITNTMLRFRYSTLVARFNSYRQHWSRINRLIEEGNYSRDRFKMELHQKEVHKETPPHHEPHPSPPSTDEIEHLYREYLAARQACHLTTAGVSRELIQGALEKQRPLLQQKYNCNDIEFHVVVEEGSPKIKARPRR